MSDIQINDTDTAMVKLRNGVVQLGISLTASQLQQLLRFIELMFKWNRTYNITGISSVDMMVTYHLLDSLALVPCIGGNYILDVGTGGGIPGIPLALALPDKRFVLLDSKRKKTRFVTQAILELALKNVEVVTSRAEKYQPDQRFDMVLTRAFASMSDALRVTQHLVLPRGKWVLMRGVVSDAELTHIPEGFCVANVTKLHVPGLDAQRYVVVVEGKDDS